MTAYIATKISAIERAAEEILSFELAPQNGSLPSFTAGSHVDVHLPNGMVRSYSLVNPPRERHRYVIAVSRDRATRGGSVLFHTQLGVGDTLMVSAPRNTFPLIEAAPYSVLCAGGIGITPLWCMIQRLEEIERPWQLYYCARSRRQAAFVEKLSTHGDLVQFRFDDEGGGRFLDFAAVIGQAPSAAHFYCCGPAPMLGAFEQATEKTPSELVHIERFGTPKDVFSARPFKVVLKKSGRSLNVRSGQSILDALLEAGVDVQHSCTQGVCGSCETRVLEGVPDHRDSVLSAAERASNSRMMVCCSGSKTDVIVLDL